MSKEVVMKANADLKKIWSRHAAKLLKGRRIVDVRYMTAKEQVDIDFRRASIVLILDNGHAIFPSMDDEGNDAGAMFTTFEELPIIPVMP